MSIAEKIEKILDDEKRLLLTGNLQNLDKIIELKTNVSDIVTANRQRMTVEQAQLITRRARENEALLDSAQRGIQAAIMHLRGAADRTFQAYSKDGQRNPLSKLEKFRQKI